MKGPELAALMKKHRYTQKLMAETIGVTDHTIRNWIKGKFKIPTAFETAILCKLGECEGKK